MRVLMVGPFPRDPDAPRGGVEAVTVNLVRGLAALPGPRIEVVASGTDIVDESTVDFPFGRVRYLPTRPGLAGWRGDLHGRVVTEVRRRDADVVHVQGIASVAARLPGSVLTVHGSAERDAFLTHAGPDRYARAAALFLLEGLPRRWARRVIATGTDDPDRPDSGHRRVWHIPNAVDPVFYGAGEPARHGDPDVFLYLGRVTPLKDVAGLIRAFRAVVAASGSARLVIAGGGMDSEYAAACRALVTRLGLRHAVSFVGSRSVGEAAGLLRAAGTLVLFSRQENAPMVVAEALAAGPAVVATGVGRIPEMLRGLPGCHLVPPRDERLLADRLLRCGDPEGAEPAALRRRAAERYRPETVARQTLDVYAELRSHPGRASRGRARRATAPVASPVPGPEATHGWQR